MVRLSGAACLVALAASAALAESPQQQMFPGADSCYARSYSKEHLASHPAQRVTQISISPDFTIADPMLGVHLQLRLRGVPGGSFETYGYCENEGAHTLYCGMEGDAGGFQITPEKGGAILNQGLKLRHDLRERLGLCHTGTQLGR